jgi:Na+/H+-dicarboxylate symporter/ABC-type amino acid transport substrate-binding protein
MAMSHPDANVRSETVKRPKLGLSARILIGLLAGIGCGLFFGEYCSSLQVLGDAFVGLLQMTVLPYITCSLILNIGRLTPQRARRTFLVGGLVLLALWAVAVVTILVTPMALPQATVGSFFSSELLKEPEPFDFIGLYIPVNPFHSLANSVVPAVVVFSIFLGVALMGVERKQTMMEILDTACRALVRVNGFVMRLTPLGMFAIAAAAAGTMRLDEVERLEMYFIVYLAASVGLTFWILPMMVACMTPFSYRQVMNESKDALVTAFATGKTFVVLPLLIEGAGRLLHGLGGDAEEAEGEAGLLVPLAYPFPTVGKLLALFFIPFAAWFVGGAMSFGQLMLLVSTGLLALFGSPVAAIPFLLDLFRLPADLFDLFLISGVVGGRLSDVVGAMHLMVFTLLVGAAMAGALKVKARRLLLVAVVGTVVFVSAIVLIRGYGEARLKEEKPPNPLASMQLQVPPAPHVILDTAEPNPDPLLPGESRIDRIGRRGIFRVGFHPNELPFSYLNESGELVGFDIEMAHRIATEMGVTLEFVPVDFDSLDMQFAADHFDIAMAGIVGGYQYLAQTLYADSRVDLTGALLVPDHRRRKFMSRSAINDLGPIKIGIVGAPRISQRFLSQFPGIELVALESHYDYVGGGREDLDGLAVVAEIGAAWTLRYPQYSVVIPSDVEVRAPLVYPVAHDAVELVAFVERWVALADDDGTTDQLYDYWILGRGTTTEDPRWSVIRNVLHWVE